MRVTILGCGSSAGVPRIGNHWGACDPNNPKNRRRRCSILVQQGPEGADPSSDEMTNVLVDTSPDMREQLLDARVGKLQGVLFTHSHADQCHGIDDLRSIALNMRARVDCYADPRTAEILGRRFDYCFNAIKGSGYPAILNLHRELEPGKLLSVKGPGGAIEALPFLHDHGSVESLGFRFGPIAYSSDVVEMPDRSFELLEGIDCWIVDCLRYKPHPTHAHLEKTLGWIERAGVRRGILTNLHIDLDYDELKAQLPPHVIPAHDGLVVEV